MEFEFDAKKCRDIGLEVKYGNVGNIVFFYDQIEDAAGYKLELFRLDFDMKQNGFLRLADIHINEGSIIGWETNITFKDEYITLKGPAYEGNNFLVMLEREDHCRRKGKVRRTELSRYPFSKVKPICTLELERNVFYASVSFLPEGNYICILKAEDRTGNEITASMPYYFKVKADDIGKRLDGIASGVRACAPHVVCI
jgi:hypothetical protein